MSGSHKRKTALSVSEGVRSPGSVNQEAIERLKGTRKEGPSVANLKDGILKGDIGLLSRAITLVESSLPRHEQDAQDLVAACLPHAGKAFRIGITGVPGAGKSTFIEALGKLILRRGGKLAVLAIDPSSERSGGSILGDKTRMEELAGDPGVYIRPSPSGGTLGGVARKTREAIILCEAAGFDTIIVETVGVGQSETAVHGMVDFFLLVMLAGAGDELQGIKRGIIELADAIVINKADGANIQKTRRAQSEFSSALHLFPAHASGWTPRVLTCSSIFQTGIEEIWEMMEGYCIRFTREGYLHNKRMEQTKYWMYESIREGIFEQVFRDPSMKSMLDHYEKEISAGTMTSYAAARAILNKFKLDDNAS
ncbi:MAG: methylmalonyl Co-A mutase-associated GTPase MeaB [Bacteroidales bacterium]